MEKTGLNSRFFLYVSLLLFVIPILYFLQDQRKGKGRLDYQQYEPIAEWFISTDTMKWGSPTGLALDSNDRLFVFHRAGRKWPLLGSMPSSKIKNKTIFVIDTKTGNLLDSWGAGLFIMPHGISIDKQNNVWVTDVGLHQVFKFSDSGKLLMSLGEAGVPGKDKAHFNQPTDVVIADNGTIYVSDGYKNSRIIKFSSKGQYLFDWGKKGKQDSEFRIPHSIDMDEKGNVYVADRENRRIQVFDSSGKFLKLYNHNMADITAVYFDKLTQNLLATDDLRFLVRHRGSDIIIFDSAGNIESCFGRSGHYRGSRNWLHDILIDRNGNIFAADLLHNRILKFGRFSR